MKQKDYYIDEAVWKKEFSNKLYALIYGKDEEKPSINKVAIAIDSDPKSIRNYLDCKSIPSALTIVKLADYFNVSIDYLLTSRNTDTEYSERTILTLATLIQNFDVTLTKENDDDVTLHIKDNVLSMILKELYYSKGSNHFSTSIENLIRAYGNMKVYQQHLISPSTFYEIIRHEYIYHDLEEYIIACTDHDGNNDCFGMDPYTFEECEKRMQEWDEMSTDDRNNWWKEYSACKQDETT